MKNPTPTNRSDDNFRVMDLFSPSDPFAHSRSQVPAPESATRPSVAGAPDSFVFTNPLFAPVRPDTKR
jgi:hypothetical protein